jgi:hypothetical protein
MANNISGRQVDVVMCSSSCDQRPCHHHFCLVGASTASLPFGSGHWKTRCSFLWHLKQSSSSVCRFRSCGVKALAMAMKSIQPLSGEDRPRPPRPPPRPLPRPNPDPSLSCQRLDASTIGSSLFCFLVGCPPLWLLYVGAGLAQPKCGESVTRPFRRFCNSTKGRM